MHRSRICHTTNMDVGKSVLFFLVYFVSGISSETVDFFSLCGSSGTSGYDRIISDYETLTVSMEDYNWSTFGIGIENSCTVVFKATGSLDDLYIKFNSFDVTGHGFEVELRSKYSSYYSLEGSYDYFSSPSIGFEDKTNTYLKITVTRSSTTDQGLSASFDVYTDIYKNNNDPTDYDEHGSLGTTIGIIIGCVIGGIALIVVIVVVIVCVVCNSNTRRNRGVVMASGNPHGTTIAIIVGCVIGGIALTVVIVVIIVCVVCNSNTRRSRVVIMTSGNPHVTTTSSAIPMYPYQAPPENYAMHPSAHPVGYPVQPGAYPAQPGAYPTQPGAYPPNQMMASPAGAPPSYNTLANGNTNPPDGGKAQPSAPQ